MQDYMQYLPHMQEIKSEILNKVLSQVQSYDESQFSAKDVKNALNQTHLSIEHLKALLSSAAEDFIEELAFKSAKTKQKYFGNSISLFTPLYLSNYCNSKCVYCGFQKGNKIARAKLSEDEIHEEMQAIAKTGLQEILMLTGEGREFASVEYIAKACKIAREYFKVVGVEIYPMNEDEYKILHENGCDYVTIFQETYNPLKYSKIHLGGEKRIFPYRFNGQERALRAGMRGVAFAALLGIAAKTVYKMIEREEIATVTEKVNNRATTLVVVTDEQIAELKKNYSKEQVSSGNYYETVTDNNHSIVDAESYEVVKYSPDNAFASEVIERIIAINDGYNEQLREYTEHLRKVNDELVTEKSKVLLLEDKAGREGSYLNEINQLKNSNKRLTRIIYFAVAVIIFLLLGLTWYVTYNVVVNDRSATENEQVIPDLDTKKTVTGNNRRP